MLSLHWWMNIGLSRFFERECARVWTHSQINPVNPGDPSIYKSSRAFYCCSFLSTWGRCTAALFVWNGALDTFGAQRQSSDGVNPKDLCQRIGGACADAWLLRWQILFWLAEQIGLVRCELHPKHFNSNRMKIWLWTVPFLRWCRYQSKYLERLHATKAWRFDPSVWSPNC